MPPFRSERLNFKNALGFPFRGEKRWANIALLAVCNLIPVIGPLVVAGYTAIAEKGLVRDIDAEPPVFNFSNFSKYLERGVAPFVVQLIVSFIMVPIIWALMFGGMLLFALTSREMPWLAITILIVFGLLFLGLIVIFPLLIMPFSLRAALLGKIGAAFDFKWCLDFLKRVGFIGIVYMIVAAIISVGLVVAGLIACYIGLFFTLVIMMLFQVHVQIQMYQLYLDRGGIPLNIPDEDMLPAFPVEGHPQTITTQPPFPPPSAPPA
jgi:hypothetical protein